MFVFWLNWPLLVPKIFSADETKITAAMGQWGDLYGSLNALSSALALAGLIITLHVQYRTSHKDGQETRFFQLSEALRALITTFKDKNAAGESYLGKQVFKLWETFVWQDIAAKYVDINLNEATAIAAGNCDYGRLNEYSVLYRHKEPELGPYFRMLYHVIRFLENSDIEDKKESADIVRAELSGPETVLLAFNCLTPQGYNFYDLVVKYGILKHLPNGDLNIPRQWFEERICGKAFEESCRCVDHDRRIVTGPRIN